MNGFAAGLLVGFVIGSVFVMFCFFAWALCEGAKRADDDRQRKFYEAEGADCSYGGTDD